MQRIIIDREFKELLPPLNKETFESLERNILANGCVFPLVTWEGILIDGHNRYAICAKYGIPFETVEKDFSSREEALIWIIANQVARRNLSPIQLSHFRGLHYRAEKKLIGNRTGHNQYSEQFRQNDGIAQGRETAAQLSNHYNVSSRTIERDAKIADAIDAIGEASPEAKERVLTGQERISKKFLEALAAKSEAEIAEAARRIADGTLAQIGDRPHRAPRAKKPVITPEEMEEVVAKYVHSEEYHNLLNGSKNGEPRAVRELLTLYIDKLVDLWRLL